jgi:hypothetical protein
MTTDWPTGRTERRQTIGDLVVASRAVRLVQHTIEQAPPSRLLEPLVFAINGSRPAATADSPILSAFLTAAARVEQWQEQLSGSDLRRPRIEAGSVGLGLQLDGVRLELAVRLRQSLHPHRLTTDLAQLSGAGLEAAQQGCTLVAEAVSGCSERLLRSHVQTARQTAGMVRTLNLMLVEKLPDHRLDA